MTDDIGQRIERFHFPRGAVACGRRNRGYTLHHALSAAPVARLRPTGRDNSFEGHLLGALLSFHSRKNAESRAERRADKAKPCLLSAG